MKKYFIILVFSIFASSPALSDNVSVSINNEAITKKQIIDITKYNLEHSQIKPSKKNIETFYPAVQYRVGQLLVMSKILRTRPLYIDNKKLKAYQARYRSLPNNLTALLATAHKWNIYTRTHITPNITTAANHTNLKMKKVQLITLPKNEKTLLTMQDIALRLKKGADFGTIAYNFSNHISWQKNGNIGWIKKGQTPYKLSRMISILHPGQVSPVFVIGSDYAIIKINSDNKKSNTQADKTIQLPLYLIQSNQERIIEAHTQNWDIQYTND